MFVVLGGGVTLGVIFLPTSANVLWKRVQLIQNASTNPLIASRQQILPTVKKIAPLFLKKDEGYE
jgi:hypothetical protein